MQASLRRPAAWPLLLSLVAHLAVAAWWWREAPPAQRPSSALTRPPMVWLRLSQAPAPTAAAAAPQSAAPVAAAAKVRPSPRPRASVTPAPAAIDAPVAAEAAPVPPAAPAAPVQGVAFGPPRFALPFVSGGGSGGGSAFGSSRTSGTTTAAAAPAVSVDPARPVREQVMRALEAQLAQWTAPTDPQPAQCRFVAVATDTGSADGPVCDSLALADAIAGRLDSLRESLAALQRLAPETNRGAQGAAFVIAFADGRYRLQVASR